VSERERERERERESGENVLHWFELVDYAGFGRYVIFLGVGRYI
jgi:hypothetical protein